MARLNTRGDAVRNAIKERTPFITNGALSGSLASTGSGRMAPDLRERYYADKAIYTVLSYGTPIAWVRADGQWVVPADKYSLTTTRHQAQVRLALGSGNYLEV